LINTLDEDKLVNAVSNNANTGNTTILGEEDIAKLQKWLQDKNLTNDNGLKLGSTGDQVKKLQTWLKENNFYAGEIDGNFGNDTETAVKAFQKEVKLKEDGQVGDYTLLAMQQWDEYAAAVTNADSTSSSSSSSSDKVYSSVSKSSKSQTTTKKSTKSKTSTKKYYSSTRYSGYTNGMDCWAMSAYLSSKLKSQGYNVRTIQYATSMSSRHRSVQYYNGNSWVNYDYKGNGYSSIYYATGNSKNGAVLG
jgi:N-acetylmuramoyl-L-alanine amidase